MSGKREEYIAGWNDARDLLASMTEAKAERCATAMERLRAQKLVGPFEVGSAPALNELAQEFRALEPPTGKDELEVDTPGIHLTDDANSTGKELGGRE